MRFFQFHLGLWRDPGQQLVQEGPVQPMAPFHVVEASMAGVEVREHGCVLREPMQRGLGWGGGAAGNKACFALSQADGQLQVS